MRVLAVDHGEKRIGLAISDQTGTVARALQIIHHVSRLTDARRVLELAARNQADLIVIGYSTDEDGKPNLAGRRSSRFATALKAMTAMPVVLWDESLSTQDAERARIASGASRKRRARPADALAAAVILQSYLDEATGLGEKIEGT